MAGTHGFAKRPLWIVRGYSEWSFAGTIGRSVIANQWLVEEVINFPARIGSVKAVAQVAGAGAGNTVLDVFLNGTSIWAATGNRPTLAAASTGEFANTVPDHRAVVLGTNGTGAVIGVQVASIPATTGHSRVMVSIVIEEV